MSRSILKKIKVGLLGLGRTGKIVATSLFHDKRFDLLFVVKDNPVKAAAFPFTTEPKEMLADLINEFNPEILIDFTTPGATMENTKYIKKGTGIVIATTGFTQDNLDRLKSKKKYKILYAPNISDGINIMTGACKYIKKHWEDADTEIIEQHFNGKKDAPSGTAKMISKALGGIPTHSVRAGGIVGIHEVIFATDTQKIVIRHESFSREVFADSAKRAVLWLYKQQNGFYTMKDIYDK